VKNHLPLVHCSLVDDFGWNVLRKQVNTLAARFFQPGGKQPLRVTGLSLIDHVLGAGFGLLRGTLVAVALVMGMMAFSQGDRPPEAVVDSRLAPFVVDAAHLFAGMAPHELNAGFGKSYALVKESWSNAIGKSMRVRGPPWL
jgi:hypothetical protein